MKRKWIKWILWTIAAPFILFFVVIVLLYIPPVQNFVCRQAAEYASSKSGMQISIGHIGLKFPLDLTVDDALVVSRRDTLLKAGRLDLSIRALPLKEGRIEVDHVRLSHTNLYSRDFIKGVCLSGRIGDALVETKVNLSAHDVRVNLASLSDSRLNVVMMPDTTKKDTTASTPWHIVVDKVKLQRVAFAYRGLPKDNLSCSAFLGDADVSSLQLNTKVPSWYSVGSLHIANGQVKYDGAPGKPKPHTFDASHLQFYNLQLRADNFYMCGKVMRINVRQCSFNERSGFSLLNLQTNLSTDSNRIYLPSFFIQTPYSEIRANGRCAWNIMKAGQYEEGVSGNVDAYIGKGDVLFWANVLPKRIIRHYPMAPLVVHASLTGNMKAMRFSRLEARLPGAFSLNGTGTFNNIMDAKRRAANVTMTMQAGQLNFLTEMAGLTDGQIAIPYGMKLALTGTMRGQSYTGRAVAQDGAGKVALQGSFNGATQQYKAKFRIHNLQTHHFLPKQQVYLLTADADAEGRGFDVKSNRTYAKCKMALGSVLYQKYKISNVNLDASLRNGMVQAKFDSNNQLLKCFADGNYHLNLRKPMGKVEMNVDDVNLYQLGMTKAPLKNAFAFTFNGEVAKDSVTGHLAAGDMKVDFNSVEDLKSLLAHFTHLSKVLMKQIKDRKLNHVALRQTLPTARLFCKIGTQNPLIEYLGLQQGISFKDVDADIRMNPIEGLNCDAKIFGLKKDSTRIDTIMLVAVQDTSHIEIHGKVINGKDNPLASFNVALNGEINSDDGKLLAEYKDKDGNTGVLLGAHFTTDPATDALKLNLIPENPVVAFREFHFQNNDLSLMPGGRVYANIDMVDKENMGFRIHSDDKDSLSLQNIDVAISHVRLDEVARLWPAWPPFSGTFSLDAHYIQSDSKQMSVAIEGDIDKLSYDHKEIGDVVLGATWVPGEDGKHYVNGYVSHEGKEVLLADGSYNPTSKGDTLSVNANFTHFPMKIANVFVPNQMASFEGDMDGDLHVNGPTSKPLFNGTVKMDSVILTYNQAGTNFKFDNRPLEIKNSRVMFDKYAIYTTGEKPFTIDGVVDFRDLSNATANLSMQAEDYALVNAQRHMGSLLYGKLIVDFNSTLKGPLTNLVMRGNMNVKNKTDITYVLDNTPLSVEDRLADLVTFTNFSDTTNVYDPTKSNVSLGGFDMRMNLHIDPSVQLKADLSADRSSQVALEGGGDLTFRYSPQGDIVLKGRYNLTGSTIRYSLPVVPLKNFTIASGSYVEWTGDAYNPRINFNATEQVNASVDMDDGESQNVSFDVGLSIKDKLTKPTLAFTLDAPENANVQNRLAMMSTEQRNKQAIVLLTTGIYLESGSKTNKLNMGTALNSVLSSQINQLAGNIKNGSFSMGVENRDDATGQTQTDYSFRYSQRLFNNRIRIVIGGRVSTGKNATNSVESFIDNVSLEYRLNDDGSRYVQLFHNKNYASILDGEITETGFGVLFHKRIDKFGELFLFRKKKK